MGVSPGPFQFPVAAQMSLHREASLPWNNQPLMHHLRHTMPNPFAPPAGDLLAALLLAWCARYPCDLATAVEKAVAGLQGVLQVTAAAVDKLEDAEHIEDAAEGAGAERAASEGPAEGEAAEGAAGEREGGGEHHVLASRERTAAVFRAKELRLVQGQRAVVAPQVVLKAEPLACQGRGHVS